MIIARFIPEYRDQLEELCLKHKINIPYSSEVWMAVDENTNKLVGLIGIRSVAFIEPLISENPLAGKKLFDRAEKFFKENKVKVVRCFTKPEHEELFNKAGFEKVFPEEIILEKQYKVEV